MERLDTVVFKQGVTQAEDAVVIIKIEAIYHYFMTFFSALNIWQAKKYVK